MPPLSEDQINSFIEKIGEVFDIPLFTETDTNRLLALAKESVKWETSIKEELTNAGLPDSLDQIQHSMISLQTLAPLFSLHNMEVSKENVTTLVDKITSGSNNLISKECMNYTAPFPRDFYILDEVKTIRPEYLIGTWFNRQERAFKLNMELDWVNRMKGNECLLPGATPMGISLFASTGEHMWDFISEVHVHRTAMIEFTRPRDGWIEAPPFGVWTMGAPHHPLDFIERMMKVKGGRTIVHLNSGTGGWATFEPVRNYEITAAAARLLFRFSDPLYCARGDGKVVIKLKDVASKGSLRDNKTVFPTTRTLADDRNSFPFCIQ